MKQNQLPNFLLVGAAKCGSTALAYYLDQHPEIYISRLKEPKFMTFQFIDRPLKGNGDDWVENFAITNFNQYRKLFSGVKNEKAVGEASADYLYYSKQTVQEIKKQLGDHVKIVIILRNPVARAFSAYKHLIRDLREDKSFEEGLELEEERIRNNWEFLWHYKKAGLYTSQVRDYQQAFKNVKILLHDDLVSKPQEMMSDLYRFLDVNPDFQPDFNIRYNTSGKPLNPFRLWMLRPTAFKAACYKQMVLHGVKDESLMWIIETIRGKNTVEPSLNKDTRQMLIEYFQEEIGNLSEVIKRDLSSWKS